MVGLTAGWLKDPDWLTDYVNGWLAKYWSPSCLIN